MGEMSLLIERFDQVARVLLQALLNSFWQGAIVAALVWMLLVVVKKVSATTRHAVWLVCLLTVGVLPIIGIVTMRGSPPADSVTQRIQRQPAVPEVQTPVPDSIFEAYPTAVEKRVARLGLPLKQIQPTVKTDQDRAPRDLGAAEFAGSMPQVLLGPVQMTIIGSSADPVQFSAGAFSTRVREWGARILKGRTPMIAISVWLVVCALMLLRIAHSYGSLLMLRRELEPVPSTHRDRVHELARTFGIRRQVRAFTSRRISMPMTIGAFRPLIILPPDLIRTLSGAEFESVIAHELAHIKRWDYLTNFLQRLVQAGLFFHPAVWLVGKHLMIERELACDDWAVKTCEPHRYASCLTRLVELLSESKPLAAAAGILFGKHVISRRVEMILNRDRNATTVVSKSALVFVIVLALVFVFLCGMISPAIAVPLAQDAAVKSQAKKENREKADQATKSQEAKPVLPPSAPGAPAMPEQPGLPETPALPGTPASPATPALPVTPALPGQPALPSVTALVQSPTQVVIEAEELEVEGPRIVAPLGLRHLNIMGAKPVVVGPMGGPIFITGLNQDRNGPVVITGVDQDGKKKSSVLSEGELLNVLTDIAKRDSDPAVRTEALRGIYRMRSDASINSLIQIYDAVNDVKVKSEIIGFLMRRNGDNSKAISKLTSIAKSDANEELRNKAIRYLSGISDDDGINNLINIYDSIQDPKVKQNVVRSLAYNRSRKAVEKLIQIAKQDSDPQIRQAAIRGLYGVDGPYRFEFRGKVGPKVGMLNENWNFDPKIFEFDSKQWNVDPKVFEFDLKKFGLDDKKLMELQKEMKEKWEIEGKKWQEKNKDLQFKLQKNQEFDQKMQKELKEKLQKHQKLDQEKQKELQKELQQKMQQDQELQQQVQIEVQKQIQLSQEILRECLKNLRIEGLDNLKIELPKIELKLKELEKNIHIEIDREKTKQLGDQLRLRLAEARSQLASLSSQHAPQNPKVIEARNLNNDLVRQIQIVNRMLSRIPKPVRI